MEPYLQNNPHIHTVEIESSTRPFDTRSSFTSLKTLLPKVRSLTIHANEQSRRCLTSTSISKSSVPLWACTLRHLELHNVECLEIASGQDSSGLGFLSQLPVLKSLGLHNVSPRLTTEDIVRCTGLVTLNLQAHVPCVATSLDMSANRRLQHLCCTGYSVSSLNLSGLTALQLLDCSNNRLLKLDVSTCTALEEVSCSKNSLKDLDVTMCRNLRVLLCSSNPIYTIQVRGCSGLEKLSCYRSKITQLDLSSCVVLRELICCSTGLQSLDVSPAAATLVKLVCQWCPGLVLCHIGCSKLTTFSR